MTFTGSSGNDVITTSNGNDTIYGGAGNDALGGGDGDDIIYDLLGATVSIFAGAGDDSIFLGSTFTSGTVGGDTGADQLTAAGISAASPFSGSRRSIRVAAPSRPLPHSWKASTSSATRRRSLRHRFR